MKLDKKKYLVSRYFMMLKGDILKYDVLQYERVRNFRIDRNLTQETVAKMLNVKQNTYSQYEIGTSKYPVEVLIKLALFYDTSVDYLVGITDNPAPYERKRKK